MSLFPFFLYLLIFVQSEDMNAPEREKKTTEKTNDNDMKIG